ncbi:hypothetical protein AU255_07865 [Methyloprofundus sedimenti]|uniref:UPF0056 membrane protein n=1 Tax=Methyloprofundus sedimenti TaxID=1420851 RepID=A0A1V8M8C3_9GAMM|nr:MarC family protein [Methyloprofundus sedimenti]OQK17768.1 hypothetical protein AU255_07865 [Methyloprofundus sedimenti]
MLEYTNYIQIFIGLLAVLDPLAAVPIVVALAPEIKQQELKRLVHTVIFSVFTILIFGLFPTSRGSHYM